MDDACSFGAWVGRRRRALRLTQHEVAGLVACSLVLIQKIEADARRPSHQVATRLAQALQIPADQQAIFVRAARAELAPDRLPAPEHGGQWLMNGAVPVPPRGNLPNQVSSFHGRTRELDDLRTLLHQKRTRLLTLTGAGGSGKTRLALQVAADMKPGYSGGIWFVDLSPVCTLDQVVTTVAHTLGIPELPDRPIRTGVLNWLRERQALLILDNCEQVIDAVADVVAELLRSAASVTVVATSRIPLRITAEQEYAVAPLVLPTSGALPAFDQLSQYDAVSLFIVRAQAVRADFDITATNAPAIAEICARLDGLPLAIELAAARIRLFPPDQLLSRLMSARMQILTGGARDLPARQQTIRATIDWSYRLLSQAQQRLLSRLGVFVGGFTLDAAEAIDTAPDTLVTLTTLVEHSLVHLQKQIDETRYAMLETIREYALERLMECGDLDATYRCHATYMVANAESAEPQLVGYAVQQALVRIAADMPNMRAAIRWACGTGEWNMAARISAALSEMFLLEQTYVIEGASWLRVCLEHGSALREDVRAKVGVCFGRIQGRIQHDSWIDDVLQESLAIAQRNDDARSMARAILVRSEQAWRNGNLVAARADAEDGLARAIVADDQVGQIWGFFSLGWILGSAGEYGEAQRTFEIGLIACRRSGYAHAMADMLLGLAEVAFLQDAIGEAETHTRARLLVEQQIGNPLGVGSCYEAQGVLAFSRRDYAEAIRQFEEGLYLYDMWMPPYSVQMRAWLCMAAALMGDLDRAMVDGCKAGDCVRLALLPTAPMASAARDSAGITAAIAALALNGGQMEIAIRLCSVLERTYTEPLSLMIASPADRPFRERVSNLARERLGDDVHFERLRADSGELTLEQVADEALAWLKEAQGEPSRQRRTIAL
jgi:predicted ATPase/transcriptional regulator with XRE-family HTH domain